ncbi:MAG: winged helix-turn-helix domain-containing protein [Pseudomonadota bacterium]
MRTKTRASRTIYKFSGFELDPHNRQLKNNGVEIECGAKAFDLLALLVTNAGDLVTRDLIRKSLWEDRTVEYDQAINNCVREVRRLLGDRVRSPEFIKTAPKHGYTFVHEVSVDTGAGGFLERALHRMGAAFLIPNFR